MKISNDHSIFAWKSPDIRGGLLATSPAAFICSKNVIEYNPFGNLSGSLTVSSKGVHIEVQFIGRGPGGLGMALLHCEEKNGEDKPLAIYLRDTTLMMELFERVCSESLESIDLQKFRPSQYPLRKICIRVGRMSIMGKPDGAGKQNGVNIYDEITLNKLMNFSDTGELFHENGQTMLFYAAISRQEALVKTLLSRIDINADSKDNSGRNTLSWVAEQGHETIAKLLFKRGVDIETKDNSGRAPLSWAVLRGNEAMVKLLFEKGADVKAKNARRAPLSWAVEGGSEAVIKMFILKWLRW
ncbi:ankyrin repeat-containing domain protein [Trichoderma evansii]